MEVINHLKEDEKRWFAIYTKFKCEKFVADQLNKRQIKCYVPLLKKTKRYASRVKEYDVPLVNCYAFVKIDKGQYLTVLQTEYVMKFIRVGKNLISIPEDEINLLKRIVGEFEVSLIGGKDFVIGREVEVIAGELTGIRGQLIEIKNKDEFVVELTTIGVQLKLQIDKALLRAV